jgi:hypothetical protein
LAEITAHSRSRPALHDADKSKPTHRPTPASAAKNHVHLTALPLEKFAEKNINSLGDKIKSLEWKIETLEKWPIIAEQAR